MRKYLSIKELAETLGLAEKTIRDWIYKGQIRYYKFGRVIRFNPDYIQEWIDKREYVPLDKAS